MSHLIVKKVRHHIFDFYFQKSQSWRTAIANVIVNVIVNVSIKVRVPVFCRPPCPHPRRPPEPTTRPEGIRPGDTREEHPSLFITP